MWQEWNCEPACLQLQSEMASWCGWQVTSQTRFWFTLLDHHIPKWTHIILTFVFLDCLPTYYYPILISKVSCIQLETGVILDYY